MNNKGSVTIFLSLIMVPVIAVSCVLVDLARYRCARKIVQGAVQISAESVLTGYHAGIKNDYGIMVLYETDEEIIERQVHELLEKNLMTELKYNSGYFDLYGFEVEDVSVSSMFNLSEDYVLEGQAAQYMKYRAPVEIVSGFVEKLKAMGSLLNQSKIMEDKLELDRKISSVRESQVFLQCLLEKKLSSLNENIRIRIHESDLNNPAEMSVSEKSLPLVNEAADDIVRIMEVLANNHTGKENINVHISRVNDFLPEAYDLEDKIDDLESQRDRVEDRILNIKAKIRQREYENSLLTGSAIKFDTSSLKEEAEELDDEYDDLGNVLSGKRSLLSDLKDKIRNENSAVESQCNKINRYLDWIGNNFELLKMHLLEHQRYLSRAIEYADIIISGTKGCDEIKGRIQEYSEEDNSTFGTKIQNEMKDQLDRIDGRKIDEDVRNPLKELKGSIDDYVLRVYAAEAGMNSIISDLDEIENVSGKIDSGDFGVRLKTFTPGFENIRSHIRPIRIGGSIPDYTAVPSPTRDEIDMFFYEFDGREIPEDPQRKENKAAYKEFKKNKKDDIREQKKQDNKNSITISDEVENGLPSFRDEDGNYVNVKNTSDIKAEITNEVSLKNSSNEIGFEEKNSGAYDIEINYSVNLGSAIVKAMKEFGERLITIVYENEYIMKTFKNSLCRLGLSDKVSDINGKPLSSRDTFFENCEVEYIIYGSKDESSNAFWTKASISGIRLILNLIHVYTEPKKSAAALTIATAIGGWSVFGVPVIKNLIMIGWSAGESFIDVDKLLSGEDVPLYKTVSTWYLSINGAVDELKDMIVKDGSKFVKNQIDKGIDRADEALKEIIREKVNYLVDSAFEKSGLDSAVDEAVSLIPDKFGSDEAEDEFKGTVQIEGLNGINSIDELDDVVKEYISSRMDEYKNKIINSSANKIKDALEHYKTELKQLIYNSIVGSSVYVEFRDKIKDTAIDVIGKGSKKVSDSLDELKKQIPDEKDAQRFAGAVVTFDYMDYLRTFLLLVPQKIKNYRMADLIQLNARKNTDGEFKVSEHGTFIYVRADISMKYLFITKWFIPGKQGMERGSIHAEWCTGY